MKKFNFPFVKYRGIFVLISAIAVAASIFVISTKGFNYGIDFQGGAKLEYKFSRHVAEDEVRSALEDLELANLSVVRFGQPSDNMMSIKVELPKEHAQISGIISPALEKTFGEDGVKLEQEGTVGPKVGEELRRRALLTIFFSWALMLIYIGYRFDYMFAPGAVLALMHDVVITLGVFAFLGKDIDLTILAAILTLIGYSINDTIVIFDRIRENKARINATTIYDVVNDSINSTLSRTMITSLTTLMVVVVLLLKGGATLHDFALVLTVGIIVGTYSSVFVASPIYIFFYKNMPKMRKMLSKG
ncbi:MAG: preprotein translocase subunit SecF [bacterium ADurb.Bin270]|jgi:preprotein translocase subunit SecF|nr:protein translocase subunit SecF [Myxococcales bacterium]OQA60916.1 MAG: preprotein translocase subunit SecF [bacterium ADurb.Bin270]HQG12802.1 protein translocase subunit SecF [bacterium]HQH79964.1 protein translocase subunit SecF [bacterium]